MQFDLQLPWLKYLDPGQENLVKTSLYLKQQFIDKNHINDFSFIVFPMAKAYEGFLKKVLLDLNLISHKVYYGRRFRIGRALNPDVSAKQRDQWWVYDDFSRVFNQELAQEVWQTWLQCRNHVFHYFPDGDRALSFDEASHCLDKMLKVMQTTIDLLEKNHHQKTNTKQTIES
jgi:hypothetical protein